MRVIIIGKGSHSQVVEQICEDMGCETYFAGYKNIDNTNEQENYLGDILDIASDIKYKDYKFILAVGDNYFRKEIFNKLKVNWFTAIHPRSYIAKNVKIGEGTLICPGVAIQTGTVIGDHCIINTSASIDHHNIIKSFSHVAPNSTLCGNVKIGEGSFIGAGSTVVPNVKIRPWSFIKANSLVKDSTCPIKIYEPYIKKYKKSIIKALDDGWISSQGEFINKTSEKLQDILNVKHVILMSNGTCATHCLFLAIKYKYPDIDTIYVPNNVYIASWNAMLMEYPKESMKVMNIDRETWNIDTDSEYINSLQKNSAVLIVHNLGNIINVPRLKRLRPDIVFVEDACEGLFGKYEGINVGASDSSLCAAFSFFANKIITSGEGGAVTTNDTELYNYLKRKINQGMTTERYIHDIHAYNYRMTNIHAGLLFDQLEDIDNILSMKQKLFENYRNLLKEKSLLSYKIEENTTPAPWIFPIRVFNNPDYSNIDEFMKSNDIEIRPFFYPITKHKHLDDIKLDDRQKEISELLSKEIVMIPSYPELTFKEQEYIIERFQEYINLF